ncbi:hypothetical protein L6164_016707 [Bauhinia variegata]|uniref:Uncharacterized protein n=1 Tax=Bauhinia variegata TaxID=167791 RepID=A0ACB9N5A0_BAUVA|nr:hypothetical protein L6164_016707 [Bauhinia variegata]
MAMGSSKSSKKPTRPPSWAWDHFTKKSIKGVMRVLCNWCGTHYACDRKRNETSNLIGHLMRQCKKFSKELRDPRQMVLSFQPKKKEEGEGKGSNLTVVCSDNEPCREALAKIIIVDELPFKFVEGDGFKCYMIVVQPLFNVPSWVTVARDCFKLYCNEKKLRHLLGLNLQHVSLTTDCWTSLQNLNYIKKLFEWGIDKVFSITVDNAYSNDDVISYMRRRINAWTKSVLKGELLRMRCCAHILNLIVMDGLKDMHDSVVKIRNTMRYVRASPTRLQRFKSCVEDEKLECKSLVSMDVPTTWNSTYLMLDTALKV